MRFKVQVSIKFQMSNTTIIHVTRELELYLSPWIYLYLTSTPIYKIHIIITLYIIRIHPLPTSGWKSTNRGVSPKMDGFLKNGKNPIFLMDDLGVPKPNYFWKHPSLLKVNHFKSLLHVTVSERSPHQLIPGASEWLREVKPLVHQWGCHAQMLDFCGIYGKKKAFQGTEIPWIRIYNIQSVVQCVLQS